MTRMKIRGSVLCFPYPPEDKKNIYLQVGDPPCNYSMLQCCSYQGPNKVMLDSLCAETTKPVFERDKYDATHVLFCPWNRYSMKNENTLQL